MDIQTFSFDIMIVCLITVDRQHRKNTDKIQTLTEDIRQRSIIRIMIIGV